MIKFVKFCLVAIVIVQSTMLQASLPQTGSEGVPLPSLSKMIKKVNPAVVNIATFSERQAQQNPLLNDPFFRRFFNIPDQPQQGDRPPQKRQQSAGSGVIVDADKGIVITNYHVIKNADEVRVSLTDNRHYSAEIVGTDPALDIAVLKIKAKNLTATEFGNSKILEVGDFVVAIGNPFGLGQTVTTGIVSALDRTGLGIEGYENFIQTDASINPGNSGGALVDLNGKLIGINTAIIAPAGGNVGIGFAIPVDMVKSSLDQILEGGEVKRGQIGVGIQDITVDLQIAFGLDNGQQGVLVTRVAKDSPADKAGMEADDIIVAVDGEKTTSVGKLKSQIGNRKVGDKVKVSIIRDGKNKTLKIKVGDPQDTAGVEGEIHKLLKGVRFENNSEGKGVTVVDLARNSVAAASGLRPGDIVVGANKIRVDDIKDLQKALRRNADSILFRVERGRSATYVVIN